MRAVLTSAVALILVASVAAQPHLTPQGNSSIQTNPAVIGGTMNFTVNGQPNALWLVAVDIAPGSINVGIGTVYIALSPFWFTPLSAFAGTAPPLGGSGTLTLPVPIAGTDGTAIYVQVLATDGAGIAFSNAKSIVFSDPDSYDATSTVMTEARAFHRCEVLPNGAYLAIGGGAGQFLSPVATAGCDRYDPYLRTWTADAPMSTPRTLHTCTTLQDGRILATGGSITGGIGLGSTEIYDPATSTWSAGPALNSSLPANACLPQPSVNARIAHAATLLNDGRVLITGGTSSFNTPVGSTNYFCIFEGALDTAEVFDPTTNTSTPLPAMNARRFAHAQVLLTDGRVLITGGVRGGQSLFGVAAPLYAQTDEIFDPTTNTFSPVPAMSVPRVTHTLNVMSDGRVMGIGGAGGTLVVSLASTEIFNPATNTWSAGPAIPGATQGIALHATTNLPDGSLYVAGGAFGAVGSFNALDLAWRYTVTGGFTMLANLPTARQAPTGVWTPEGVLIVGGGGGGGMGATVDTSSIWTPPL